jgi:tetratricopeptide (TPR) repeat protein
MSDYEPLSELYNQFQQLQHITQLETIAANIRDIIERWLRRKSIDDIKLALKTSNNNNNTTTTILNEMIEFVANGINTSVEDTMDNFNAALYDLNEFSNVDVEQQHLLKSLLYFLRGDFYLVDKVFDKAIEDYTSIIDLFPIYSMVYLRRGTCYNYMEQVELAIEDFSTAIQMDQSCRDGFMKRGLCYLNHHEDYSLALCDFTRAIEIDPTNPEGYLERGLCYHEMGEFNLASEDFTKDIELNPECENAYFYRGICNFREDRLSQAIDDLTRKIEISDDESSYYYRGLCYMDQQKFQRAIDDFTSSIEMDVDGKHSYEAIDNIGFCHRKLNMNTEAISDYTQAIELDPQCVDGYIDRALIYYETGRYEECMEDIRKVLVDLEPENEEAEELKRNCQSKLPLNPVINNQQHSLA